jgi:hypothetical protein
MKLNKHEAREYRKKKLQFDLRGAGLYVYRNASKDADLMLPKPALNKVKVVGPGQEFQGDDYFMDMVRKNEVRLVRVLLTPEQEKEAKMAEEKLILDQPDIITEAGTVEHVVQATPEKPLNETPTDPSAQEEPVLINEDPVDVDGIEMG